MEEIYLELKRGDLIVYQYHDTSPEYAIFLWEEVNTTGPHTHRTYWCYSLNPVARRPNVDYFCENDFKHITKLT
jgi:hypothetical protein